MEVILVVRHSLMLRRSTEVLISWTFLSLTYENHIRTSLSDVLRTSVGHAPWSYRFDHMGRSSLHLQETSSRRQQGTSLGVTYRTLWGRPQDATLGGPQGVILQRLKDVRRGFPLVLHRGPYGKVDRTSFGDVLRTSSGCNFAELEVESITCTLE